MSEPLRCKRPDHDEPRMVCGFPLPCPYHTYVIDMVNKSVHVPSGKSLSRKLARRLQMIADALEQP